MDRSMALPRKRCFGEASRFSVEIEMETHVERSFVLRHELDPSKPDGEQAPARLPRRYLSLKSKRDR
jgi:hypothetical protein